MSISLRYPDGNSETVSTGVAGLDGDWEVILDEDEYGLRFTLNKLNKVSCQDEFCFPEVSASSRIDVNFSGDFGTPNLSFSESDNGIEYVAMGAMAGASMPAGFFERWKRPGPCNALFMIGEAWELGKIFTGAVDQYQESDDFYVGFDSDGNPILENDVEAGHIGIPLSLLVLMDVARRFLTWKVSFCRFRDPDDKPKDGAGKTDTVVTEAEAVQEGVLAGEKALAPVPEPETGKELAPSPGTEDVKALAPKTANSMVLYPEGSWRDVLNMAEVGGDYVYMQGQSDLLVSEDSNYFSQVLGIPLSVFKSFSFKGVSVPRAAPIPRPVLKPIPVMR